MEIPLRLEHELERYAWQLLEISGDGPSYAAVYMEWAEWAGELLILPLFFATLINELIKGELTHVTLEEPPTRLLFLAPGRDELDERASHWPSCRALFVRAVAERGVKAGANSQRGQTLPLPDISTRELSGTRGHRLAPLRTVSLPIPDVDASLLLRILHLQQARDILRAQ